MNSSWLALPRKWFGSYEPFSASMRVSQSLRSFGTPQPLVISTNPSLSFRQTQWGEILSQ